MIRRRSLFAIWSTRGSERSIGTPAMKTQRLVNVAVALEWDGTSAPKVTAKGRGEIAQRIADVAAKHGVPLTDEGDLAEVLAEVNLGQTIPPAMFVAVAEVIAFAYQVRGVLPDHVEQRHARKRST